MATYQHNFNGQVIRIEERDCTPETFSDVIYQAAMRAGDRGVVQLAKGYYPSLNCVYLPENLRVTLCGAGKGKTFIVLLPNGRGSREARPGFINVGANGTVIAKLKVDTGYNLRYAVASCAINTNGRQCVLVDDVEVSNSGIGIGTPDNDFGYVPHGLTCQGCIFTNCEHGILFNRKIRNDPRRGEWVKQMKIIGCSFVGEQIAGISIDCGNDGLDGNPVLGDLRSQLGMDTITNLDDMEIRGCFFKKAKKYNIALAKVSNARIIDNHFEGAYGIYGEAINIEHSAYDIIIEANRFYGGYGEHPQAHISILTFRDYHEDRSARFGAPENFFMGDGCCDIVIRDNCFRGNVKSYVVGEFAKNISIVNNRCKCPPRHGPDMFNFWVGSENIVVQDNMFSRFH